jgi:hypothetical protein
MPLQILERHPAEIAWLYNHPRYNQVYVDVFSGYQFQPTDDTIRWMQLLRD